MDNTAEGVPYQLERTIFAEQWCSATLIQGGRGVLACGRDCWEYPSVSEALAAWFEVTSDPTKAVPQGWTRRYTK